MESTTGICSPAMETITAVKTAVFKLHNPSRRKRAMLDYALLQNHLAYTKALRAADALIARLVKEELEQREHEGPLDKEKRRARSRRKIEREKELSAFIGRILKPLPICLASKAARGICGSIIGQVESHIELHGEQDSVGVPTAQKLKVTASDREAVLRRLADSTRLEDENAARDDLLRFGKSGALRPLLLPTNRASDGFLLLRDDTNGKLFAYLNLVPSRSRFARLTEMEQRPGSSRNIAGLTDLRTGEVKTFRSTTGCLFPLEYSRDYQVAEFISRGRPLAAKLLVRDGHYQLHISFEFVTHKVETKTWLGADRGIYNLAALAVIDDSGSVVEARAVDGRDLRHVQKTLERRQRRLQRRGKPFRGRAKRHAADEAVHRTANEIVALACKHGSQVIIENLSQLTHRGSKRGRSNFNRVLNRSQYQKLQRVLTYKMAVAGLPKALEVHPAHTSQTCPACGHRDPANRLKTPQADGFRMDVFLCVKCGYRADADLNAARVIALKRLWRDGLSPALRPKPMDEVPIHKGFSEFLRARAERRGERACDREVGTFGRAGLDGQYGGGEVPPGSRSDAAAVEPRSGSNAPAGQITPAKLPAVSPSDGTPHFDEPEKTGAPDG